MHANDFPVVWKSQKNTYGNYEESGKKGSYLRPNAIRTPQPEVAPSLY